MVTSTKNNMLEKELVNELFTEVNLMINEFRSRYVNNSEEEATLEKCRVEALLLDVKHKIYHFRCNNELLSNEEQKNREKLLSWIGIKK